MQLTWLKAYCEMKVGALMHSEVLFFLNLNLSFMMSVKMKTDNTFVNESIVNLLCNIMCIFDEHGRDKDDPRT